MATVERRKNAKKERDKVKIGFDVSVLNTIIKYVRCEYVAPTDRNTLVRLIDSLDMEAYHYDNDVYDRLQLLNALLRATTKENLSDESLIRTYIVKDYPDGEQIIDDIGLAKNQLPSKDCEYVTKMIREKYQCIEVYKAKDEIIHLLQNLDNTSYETSYYELIQNLKDKMSMLLSSLQNPTEEVGLLREFSFSDESFAKLIDVIVKKRKRPASVLQTGIRQLNAILSPGFQSSRLYTIIGGSGRFKSGTLLNIADQIRRFNPQIVPFENGMRKTILFITLENSIEETVERIYDMYSDVNDDITYRDTKEVIEILRTDGHFSFTGDEGIDICIRYYSNLEIDTGEIYGIVQGLHDRGKEVIGIILDYIKRINSSHPNGGDERVRMSFVAKELKAIAQFYEIPVITAMQLNREGNSIIDAAMRENKQDVARFVGSSSIGNAWDIIEDSDWVALINLEVQKSTGNLFLTFKRLKIRGKSKIHTVDYFNHPFVNEKNIRLQHDVDKAEPVSIISLASDLESIVEKEDDVDSNAPAKLNRPRIASMKAEYEKRSISPIMPVDINLDAF